MGRRAACAAPWRALATAGSVAIATATTGCASPNTYATARTLSPGNVTHTLAAEGLAYHGPQGTGGIPTLPTYALRVGLFPRVDVGARIGSLTEIGADLKVNVLRGPLDVAIAGGAEAFIEWRYQPDGIRRTGSRAYFHLPVIVSYNLAKQLSIVATPGLAYVVGRQVSDDFVRTQVFDGGTLGARLGFGFDFRWAKNRAFHPEVTLIKSTQSTATLVTLGLGFTFGALPEYDDVKE